MAAEWLIEPGTGVATSPDIAVTDSPVTLVLNTPAAAAEVIIESKGPGSVWVPLGVLSNSNPAQIVQGPGVWRVRRTAMSAAAGVYRA